MLNYDEIFIVNGFFAQNKQLKLKKKLFEKKLKALKDEIEELKDSCPKVKSGVHQGKYPRNIRILEEEIQKVKGKYDAKEIVTPKDFRIIIETEKKLGGKSLVLKAAYRCSAFTPFSKANLLDIIYPENSSMNYRSGFSNN